MGLFFNFPLLSRFSDVFWKYISWNFNPSCTRFLAFQEVENSCVGGAIINIQLGKRPKSVGWMVWTGRHFEWRVVTDISSTFSPSYSFWPIYGPLKEAWRYFFRFPWWQLSLSLVLIFFATLVARKFDVRPFDIWKSAQNSHNHSSNKERTMAEIEKITSKQCYIKGDAKKTRVHPKFDLNSKCNNLWRVGPIYLKINDRIVHNSEPGHTKF